MKLRTFLLAVVCLTLLPMLAVSLIAIWWLATAVPSEQIEAPLRRSLWLLAGGTLVAFVLAPSPSPTWAGGGSESACAG